MACQTMLSGMKFSITGRQNSHVALALLHFGTNVLLILAALILSTLNGGVFKMQNTLIVFLSADALSYFPFISFRHR